MRYTGFQPQYFPRLFYIARILNTDTFVVRDDCQFVRKHKYPDGHNGPSYQAHTPIKQTSGLYFLTVETVHGGLAALNQTHLSLQSDWHKKHINTIRFSYRSSANFPRLFPQIEALLSQSYPSLAALNLTTILWAILTLLGETPVPADHLTLEYVNQRLQQPHPFRLKTIIPATSLQSFPSFATMNANEKIIASMKEVGATEDYCGGTAMAAYVDTKLFEQAGITITVQDWQCAPYTQQFPAQGFIPNLSIIDLLFNEPVLTCQTLLGSTQ